MPPSQIVTTLFEESTGGIALTHGQSLTTFLRALSNAEGPDAVRFMDQVQRELRQIATQSMRWQPLDHTLQVTALINEAVLKIMRAGQSDWHDRTHFFAAASKAMRHILVDCAKRRKNRRSCAEELGHIERLVEPYERTTGDLEELDLALRKLAEVDPVGCQLIELKFFLGLPMGEVAASLDLPQRTAERRWTSVRAWLHQELNHDT